MDFTIEDFRKLNKGNENLGSYFGDWVPETGFPFNFNEKKVRENFEIFQEMQTNRSIMDSSVDRPRNGDVIHLPDNKMVFVCHVWDDKVQTTSGGSYSVGRTGGMSYSGGLDAGISLSDLMPSDEQDLCTCWFFEGNWARAHSAVYAKMKVKVWKVKPGSDLSGVWESMKRND